MSELQIFHRTLWQARWVWHAWVGLSCFWSLGRFSGYQVLFGLVGVLVLLDLFLAVQWERSRSLGPQRRWVLVAASADVLLVALFQALAWPVARSFFWLLLLPVAHVALVHPAATAVKFAWLATGINLVPVWIPPLDSVAGRILELGLRLLALPGLVALVGYLSQLILQAAPRLHLIQELRPRIGNVFDEPLLLKGAMQVAAERLPAQVCYVMYEDRDTYPGWIASVAAAEPADQAAVYERLAQLAPETGVLRIPNLAAHAAFQGGPPAPPWSALVQRLDFGASWVAVGPAGPELAWGAEEQVQQLGLELEQGVRWCRRWAQQERAARLDPLTQLLSREQFRQELGAELRRAQRYQNRVVVGLGRLEDLAEYNRLYSYAQGDQLIVRVARLLEGKVSPADRVARWSGASFSVVLLGRTRDQAQEWAADIQRTVARSLHWKATAESPSRPVSLRWGLAVYPEEGDSPLALIETCQQQLQAGEGKG